MTEYHLAQVNIGRFIEEPGHPDNKDFMDALDHVNAVAEASDGFVWRLTGEGNNATDVRISDDPKLAINLSVWRDLDALSKFVYRTPDHAQVMRRRREWFEHMDVFMALWWVPVGHVPTIEEALARIAHLRVHGPTVEAFSFRKPFAAPDGTPARPVLDKCA